MSVWYNLVEGIISSDSKMIEDYKQLINQGYNDTFTNGLGLEFKMHLENAKKSTQKILIYLTAKRFKKEN